MFAKFASVCDILLKAKLLDREHLAPLQLYASEHGTTPGEFLYRSAAMDPPLIRAAILSLILMNDKLLPVDTAVSALRVVMRDGIHFEEALVKTGWNRNYFEHTRTLTKLLVSAAVVSPAQCELLYDLCCPTQLPIMETLVERQLITEPFADVALTVENLVLNDVLTFELAVVALKRVHAENEPLETAISHALQDADAVKPSLQVMLGSLLLGADLVGSKELLHAVEQGKIQSRRFGEILVDAGIVTQEKVERGLQIQKLVNDQVVSLQEGTFALRCDEPLEAIFSKMAVAARGQQ